MKITDEDIKKGRALCDQGKGDEAVALTLMTINNTLDEKLERYIKQKIESNKTVEGLLADIHSAIIEASKE